MAEQAVGLLLQRMDDATGEPQEVFPDYALVVRQSSVAG